MPKRKSKGQRRKIERGPSRRDLEYKDDSQEYAQIIKMLGSGRCKVYCFDGAERLAHIRGAMRNKVWISMSDFVLVGLRDFQDNKCDIILKYTTEEVRNLKSYGELPEDTSLVVQKEEEETITPFDFDDI
jgi:translation initiation factor 1A